jgi:hypothetical protein
MESLTTEIKNMCKTYNKILLFFISFRYFDIKAVEIYFKYLAYHF